MSCTLCTAPLLAYADASHAASPLTMRATYVIHCSGCHGLQGAGNRDGGIPDFHNSVSALSKDDDGRTYLSQVPGVASSGLSNQQIAEVLNYVIITWRTDSDLPLTPFTSTEVAERRHRVVADIVELRRQVVTRLQSRGIVTALYPWP